MSLLLSFYGISSVFAQNSPANCKSGCTSNDVQIITAYLSDVSGNKLSSDFDCTGGSADVYLTLELTTKTPRKGVVIYANINHFTPPATVGDNYLLSGAIKECFGIALNQPLNKVTFGQSFIWTCGDAIVLTDVFLGWGTGNTDFCAGSRAFRCPATPSKCYQLPSGEYIVIDTPNPGTATAAKCSEVAGSYSAYFDLTSYEGGIRAEQTLDVTISWFSDSDLTDPISDEVKLNFHAIAASTDVYANVCSVTNPSACSKTTVTLTVKEKPAPPTICVVHPSLCGSTTGSITVTAPLNGGGIKYQYSLDGGTWVENPIFSNLAAGSVNSGVRVRIMTGDIGGCPSAPASCGDSNCGTSLRIADKKIDTFIQKTIAITPIEAKTEKYVFDAYPVPFKDQLTVKYKFDYVSDVKIEVFNSRGIRVLTKTDTNSYMNKEITLDLNASKEKEQLYVVKLTTDRESYTKKVMSSR